MSAATAGIRMLGELAGLGETEARFYRELAPELGAGVPRSYGSAFDTLTGRFVVVLEDMTTSPCQFPDTLHPLSTDQMAQLVEVLARTARDVLGRLPEKSGGGGQFGWLMAPSDDPAQSPDAVGDADVGAPTGRPTSIPVDAGRYIWENFPAVVAAIDSGPHTVLARRFPPREHLRPRRPGGAAGLAGRPARPSLPRPRLRDRPRHAGQ